MQLQDDSRRSIGLIGATLIGVGAIVGGGILALAGIAFATTGPSAIVAFAVNGGIAVLTALSFAQLATRFPESGGTYTYARKVLAVDAAFAVGWVVWFASIVAAVLYALGFGVFLVPVLEQIVLACGGNPPGWLGARFAVVAYAVVAVAFYSWALVRSAGGGSQWPAVAKVVVFVAIIVGGLWVMVVHPPGAATLRGRFAPFFHHGGGGLVQAMGYTFIALQGFDLIAAVGGEIKQPERTIPRAMLLSLGTALVIYLPLLFLIVAIGVPGGSIAAAAERNPEILIASAVGNFLGPAGYWLIVVAGLLSMLSALQANLLAASRFVRTMATDRTLPRRFGQMASANGTPVPAILLTAVTVAFLLIALPDVATAGAMSSLIFLASFALIHGLAYLVQRRDGVSHFQSAAFPLIPVIGGAACLALALFQSVAVPSAGALAAMWLGVGAVVYVIYLAPGAKVVDASAVALDPGILRSRGQSPLVLVPIANPASAPMLVSMADALTPSGVARVLLLSVVRPPRDWSGEGLPTPLVDAQNILGNALSTAFKASLATEALITMGQDPWSEIERIADRYRCQSLVLGFGRLNESLMTGALETLMSRVRGDVKIVRAPMTWKVDDAQRILVAAAGRRDQSRIRAHLIGNMCRTRPREVTYLRVLPTTASAADERRARRDLVRLAADEAPGVSRIVVVRSDDTVSVITDRAAECDLLVLGLQRLDRRNKVFGDLVLDIAARTTCPLLMMSQGR